MEQNIINKIQEEYNKGKDLNEIRKTLNLSFTTSELYKIVKTFRNGILDKEKVIEEYKKGIKFFQIAKKMGIPYDEAMRVINTYRKDNNEYNHGKFGDIAGKIKMDREFFKFLQPKSVLDAFAGENKKYPKEITTSNDIDKKCDTTYHKNANTLLETMVLEGYKFDLVDLDPYGSCSNCWQNGIDVAQRGIIISYGDLMTWRYHCKDDKYWYPIVNRKVTSIHDLKFALINHTIELGTYLGKNLHIYNTFGNWYWQRVYYTIE